MFLKEKKKSLSHFSCAKLLHLILKKIYIAALSPSSVCEEKRFQSCSEEDYTPVQITYKNSLISHLRTFSYEQAHI